MAFLRQGFRVSTASHKGHPLRYVAGISQHHSYGGVNALRQLQSAIELEQPTLIVPCDDGAVWQLHDLHQQLPALRPLLEFSLGRPETYPTLRSRALLLDTAMSLGIRVPATCPVHSEQDIRAAGFSGHAVLKLDGTCAGNGVRIVHSLEQATSAFRDFSRPQTLAGAYKQLVIDRDPTPLFALRSRRQPSVTMQQFIAGRPANAMVACQQGRVLGMVTAEVLSTHGATGAATVVRIIEHPRITAAARLLAEKLQLTGFHGLDFLLHQETGLPYLIELNPRATQLGHLRLPGKGDLVGTFCAEIGQVPRPDNRGLHNEAIGNDIVAFFPQAAASNPHSPYLTTGYHDVPYEQPQLHQELLREPWPDRQPLARAYHFFRPRKRQEEASFAEERVLVAEG